MGGSKAPPKVDRSTERNAWIETQNKARRQQAEAFNQQVASWNSGLQTKLTNAANLRSRASNMSMLDDEFFGEVDRSVGDLRSAIQNYNFNLQAPRWEASVNSGIADDFSSGIVTLDVPSLAGANVDGRQSGLSDLESALNALSSLRQQRTAEEDRVRSAINQARGAQSNLTSRLGSMNLADYRTNRDSLASQLGDLRTSITGFSSRLFDDGFMTNDRTQLMSGLDTLAARKNALATDLTNEESRINAFRQELQSGLLRERGDITGRTIADIDGINQDFQDLTNLRSRVAGFSSQLNPDFNPLISELQGLEGQIGTLRQQRTAEEQRIAQARAEALGAAGNLRANLGGANIYDLNTINQLRGQRNEIDSRLRGFSSLLNPNFDDVRSQLTEVDTTLNDLVSQRGTELQGLLGQAGRSVENLAGVELQNEAEIRNRLTQLERARNQLSSFSGNDLADERAAMSGFETQLQDRLTQLNSRRADIESRAKQLAAQLQNGTFTELSQLDPLEAQRAQLAAEQELFAALQAMDELDTIRSRLGSERGRIERDIANRNNARTAEQQAMQSMQRSTQGGLSGVGLTEDQIRQILMGINTRRDDQLLAPGAQAALA